MSRDRLSGYTFTSKLIRNLTRVVVERDTRKTVPAPQHSLLAFVYPSEPIERESSDTHKQRPIQSLNALERGSTRNSEEPWRRPQAPSCCEVRERTRNLRPMLIRVPNRVLEDVRPRASGRLCPAGASAGSGRRK